MTCGFLFVDLNFVIKLQDVQAVVRDCDHGLRCQRYRNRRTGIVKSLCLGDDGRIIGFVCGTAFAVDDNVVAAVLADSGCVGASARWKT